MLLAYQFFALLLASIVCGETITDSDGENFNIYIIKPLEGQTFPLMDEFFQVEWSGDHERIMSKHGERGQICLMGRDPSFESPMPEREVCSFIDGRLRNTLPKATSNAPGSQYNERRIKAL